MINWTALIVFLLLFGLVTSPSPAPAGPSAPGLGTPGRSLRCSVMTIHITTPSTGM